VYDRGGVEPSFFGDLFFHLTGLVGRAGVVHALEKVETDATSLARDSPPLCPWGFG
jgi:hypothetical protein